MRVLTVTSGAPPPFADLPLEPEADAEEFLQLAESIPQIVWRTTADGWADYYNARWFAYTDLTLGESFGWGWERVLHPDDVDLCMERWTHAIATGEPFEMEYRLRRAADGTYRWHLARAVPVLGEGGRILKWFGTCTDIDEQKLAADGLRRATVAEARHDGARRFRAFIETVRTAALELDTNGRVLFVNQRMLDLTGYARAELLGADWFEKCSPQSASARAEFLAAIAADEVPASQEHELLTKSGIVRVLELDNSPQRDERGQIIGIASFGSDVTERRAESAALTLLLEVTRAIAEAPELDDALAVVLQQLCATTGWTYGEIWLPSSDGSIIVRTRAHHTRMGLEAFSEASDGMRLRIGDDLPGTAWARRATVWSPDLAKDGSFRRQFQAEDAKLHAGAAIPVLDGESVVAVLCFLMDFPRPSDERRLALIGVVAHQLGSVVARRRVEQEVVHARDVAVAANRAKSDFLARMSHELRTPLNSIIGFGDLLARSASFAGNALDSKLIDRVRANGRHLLGLINDVLDLSKVEAGHLTLEHSLVRVDELVREVVSGLAFRIADRDVRLHCVVPEHILPAYTDETRLRQVLLNLVGNALKFTEAGEVCVTLEADPFTGAPLRLIVRDTGIGIPADRHGAVFDAFEQADASVTRRFGGTGLGLSITRALCEAMQYRLTLESEVGRGSSFVVELRTSLARRTD